MVAPQESIPLSATVLSLIGTVFWCVQLIPQIWHNWKTKSTEGLPGAMVFLWAICAVPFGVYAIVQNFAIPIQVQPQCFGFFALITWAQVLYYNNGWTVRNAALVAAGMMVALAGAQVLLVFTIRIPYGKGVGWPIILIGVIATILLAAGLIPPYYEIWRRRGRVVGINWVFLSVDSLGGIFSLLAVVMQDTFDVLGGIMYATVIVMEAVIFLSHAIWLLRTKSIRRRAKEKGLDFDDTPEAKPYQYKKQAAVVQQADHPTTLETETEGKPEVQSPRTEDIEAQA